MASEASATKPERNVLEDLDSRIPTNFYWYLAVLACIGGFLFGYDTSNIGSALAFIPYHLSSFATGYLVAGASLGAAAGALVAGPLTDHFGRKALLISDAAIYAIGSILSAVTINAGMLLASRTLIGLAIGADSAIATAYIAEFAPRSRRGQLSIIQQWMITVGILVSYLVAVIILKAAPVSAGGADWRLILGLGGVPALIAVALRSHMPESPRWLMLHGRYDDTRKAFGRLGMDVTVDEVRHAADELAGLERQRQRKTQWTRGVRRALIIVCVFFIFQQITGINVPFYYGPTILSSFFQSGGHNAVERRGRRSRGHGDPWRGQRHRDVLRLPVDRQGGPAPAGHLRLHGHDGVHSGGGGRGGVPDRHPEDRGGHGRVLLLHHVVRDRRRRDGLADPGRGLPDRGQGPGGGHRRLRRLAGQLRAHRGVPRLAQRHRARVGHGVLRRALRRWPSGSCTSSCRRRRGCRWSRPSTSSSGRRRESPHP